MKTDRLTKTLLALIALALFINALNPWLLPEPALAAPVQAEFGMMETYLERIDFNVGMIQAGTCANSMVC